MAKQCTGKAKMLDLIRQYQDMGDYTEEDWGELRENVSGNVHRSGQPVSPPVPGAGRKGNL